MLGTSQTTSFGSLQCQVKVRSREGDPLAVYLKKGRLMSWMAGKGGGVWRWRGVEVAGWPTGFTCSVFGASFPQGEFRGGPHCPWPQGTGEALLLVRG